MIETAQTITFAVQISEPDAVDGLKNLLRARGFSPDLVTGKQLQEFAEWLRQYAPATGRPVRWGKDYIDNVLHERKGFKPSAALVHATMTALANLGGLPMIWVKSRPVQVYAAGNIKPGTLITRDSRDCPICGRPFIPNSWNDANCSPECDRTARRWKHPANGKVHA